MSTHSMPLPKPSENQRVAMNVRGPVAPDGTRRGDAIAGSRFYREFCATCETPIRVRTEQTFRRNYCEDCNPVSL